ncbi:FlgK family flagellar hook-associated protein, partial [Enterococcus faecium]|uniref:FlgK family flagellar hook-associated protein n=1 Tax=Enterococcus faecium TaxID=1352 RepID=UPI003F43AB03
LTTGSLGGLLTFRTTDLDAARNRLGQLALSFAGSFNTQHEAGFDANGDAGQAFFAIGSPAVLSNVKNTSATTLTAAVTNSSSVLATDYNVTW